MANNNFNETIGSMFKGLDTLIGTKTVVGEPTFVGDTIIVPLVDVNFGIAAGDTITKIIDMVPDVVDKVASIKNKGAKSPEQTAVDNKIEEIAETETKL